ncbi:MAG TPA: hypothetical protein VJ868_06080 [Actinomycetota bacterium]|nr:hypothetical protein [Actinomycetota bacterium]
MAPERVTEEQLRELAVLGRRFAETAEPLLVEALERAMESLAVANGHVLDGLNEESREAFRRAIEEAIHQGAREATRSVRDQEIWLEPSVDPQGEPARRLDHPSNRAWIRLSRAAAALDPVLGEFGFIPSPTADPGGGHFGLQPRTAADLDPRGRLTRIWEEYRRTYRRMAEDRRAGTRGRALRWWRRS